MPRLVLLDRDGVINEDREDSVKSIEEFVFLNGAAAAIRRLNQAGQKVAIVTNQSIVGRGIISESDLQNIHIHMQDFLLKEGARIDAIYFAPDAPDQATDRRKPNPGMVIEAMRDFATPPEATVFIGDALRDLEAAHQAGCGKILVRTGRGKKTEAAGIPAHLLPVPIDDDLSDAVNRILSLS